MLNKITFIDNIGRSILGELVTETETVLNVKNPAMISVAASENGQLQVQLIPLFFHEFLSETTRDNGSVWVYNRSNITLPDSVELDEKLTNQYERMFTPPSAIIKPSGDEVIRLFDEN